MKGSDTHEVGLSWVQRMAGKPQVWLLIILVIACLAIFRQLTLKSVEMPPVLGSVQSFTLENQRGEVFGTEQLQGGIWFGSVVCTACNSMDPAMLGRLSEVQHRSRGLGNDFHLVSLSLDPERDTTDALYQLARSSGASTRAWMFLRGAEKSLFAVIVDLYGMHSGSDPASPLQGSLSPDQPHMMVLVDQIGQVRGRYDLRQMEEVDRMMVHAGLIANAPFRKSPVAP